MLAVALCLPLNLSVPTSYKLCALAQTIAIATTPTNIAAELVEDVNRMAENLFKAIVSLSSVVFFLGVFHTGTAFERGALEILKSNTGTMQYVMIIYVLRKFIYVIKRHFYFFNKNAFFNVIF